jgi:exodeoxyribonuclease V beta subunit
MQDDPCGCMRKKMVAKFKNGNQISGIKNEEFEANLKNFCDNANTVKPDNVVINHAVVSYRELKQCAGPIYIDMSPRDINELITAKPLQRYLVPSWLQTSFSGLTAGQHASVERQQRSEHADDIPEIRADEIQAEDPSVIDSFSIFSFPRGAMPGECLHHIFEHWDFANTDKESLKTLVADSMNRFSIAKPESRPEWYETVADAVLNTLNKPLKTAATPTGFCLAKVAAEHRQAELEFLLAARGSTDVIKTLLLDPKFELPLVFVEASKQLNHKRIEGFLTGFIDLVFKDEQGRYHVLDWKSNHLGYSSQDYAPDRIEHAMAETHYYLQALIYLLALHRYLQQQLPDYDIEQHLGGAWYAFVRGVDINQPEDEPVNGIYQLTPSIALILALDKLLIHQEAVE